MTNPYVLATFVFYSASLALYIWNLREYSRPVGIGATTCLIIGLGLHYLALLDRSRQIHAVPYDDLFGSLSLFAWLLAATYLGLEAIHRQPIGRPVRIADSAGFVSVRARAGSACDSRLLRRKVRFSLFTSR